MSIAVRSGGTLLLSVLVSSFCIAPSVLAQGNSPGAPSRVLVLGTYHFANPGLDVAQVEVASGRLEAEHGTYMRFNRVGAGDTYVGAELVSTWYERNIHIFANLQRISEPGDRILVIFGAGHAPILRELVESDPEMTFVAAGPYLPSE